MSWLKTFTESVKLVSQDVAHMAEDIVGKAGESLRKMAQTDDVASVEEAACSVRDLGGAILMLQGWNQDLNKKIGQISDERLMEHGVGATPTKRDTSFVGEEKSPSTLAIEEDRGGQQEHDASIVLEHQQGTTTTTTTGHQGTQGTTGHDL
ncbi:unnamed protein product [Amoebophrya sp. A25]|nr:unnamed protein product [Amoebophrya sp. A25]|eukprot:GSA25T00024262001.1